MTPKDPCGNCPHDRSDHCKAGTAHGNYKTRVGEKDFREPVICEKAHCKAPMCCCLEFVEVTA